MGSPASLSRFVSRLRLYAVADFHAPRPTRFHGDVQNPARLPFSVTPECSVITRKRWYRNIDLLCIGYAAYGLALAPD